MRSLKSYNLITKLSYNFTKYFFVLDMNFNKSVNKFYFFLIFFIFVKFIKKLKIDSYAINKYLNCKFL